MAVVIFFVGLISMLRDDRISLDTDHIILVLAVGILTYFDVPVHDPDEPP